MARIKNRSEIDKATNTQKKKKKKKNHNKQKTAKHATNKHITQITKQTNNKTKHKQTNKKQQTNKQKTNKKQQTNKQKTTNKQTKNNKQTNKKQQTNKQKTTNKQQTKHRHQHIQVLCKASKTQNERCPAVNLPSQRLHDKLVQNAPTVVPNPRQ